MGGALHLKNVSLELFKDQILIQTQNSLHAVVLLGIGENAWIVLQSLIAVNVANGMALARGALETETFQHLAKPVEPKIATHCKHAHVQFTLLAANVLIQFFADGVAAPTKLACQDQILLNLVHYQQFNAHAL